MNRMIAVALMLGLAGCQPRSDPTGPAINPGGRNGNPRVGAGDPPAWPFWPTRLRIHPATRLVHDQTSGKLVIEARIEFFDPDGATTKALGELTLQLLNTADAAAHTEPIQTWNLDLSDLAINRRQYDEVFRTYLFRLELGQEQLPQDAELRAYFLSADGQKLDATLKIRHGNE